MSLVGLGVWVRRKAPLICDDACCRGTRSAVQGGISAVKLGQALPVVATAGPRWSARWWGAATASAAHKNTPSRLVARWRVEEDAAVCAEPYSVALEWPAWHRWRGNSLPALGHRPQPAGTATMSPTASRGSVHRFRLSGSSDSSGEWVRGVVGALPLRGAPLRHSA